MKRYGIVSYNFYGNFTNYGSMLQSWALCRAVNRLGEGEYSAVVVDYLPDILLDKDPLNPMKNMWDTDPASLEMCRQSLPAIRENYRKFRDFWKERMDKTLRSYTSQNFSEVIAAEGLDGFICGSDTIFNINELGFDDGYYAVYPCMKNGHTVAYAASFGDAVFDEKTFRLLDKKLLNFKAIGLREEEMISYVREHTSVPVRKVIDPTLLLTAEDYDPLAEGRLIQEKYLLLYARRHNPAMTEYAEKLAARHGWKIVEISLRAENSARGHRMFYEAGIEEFLSLVKYAEYVVTNSFHGMIFSVQYRRPFVIFSRAQCDTKIRELLAMFGLSDRKLISGNETVREDMDYDAVHAKIAAARKESIRFLSMELNIMSREES